MVVCILSGISLMSYFHIINNNDDDNNNKYKSSSTTTITTTATTASLLSPSKKLNQLQEFTRYSYKTTTLSTASSSTRNDSINEIIPQQHTTITTTTTKTIASSDIENDNILRRLPNPKTIFICGYDRTKILGKIFPEYQTTAIELSNNNNKNNQTIASGSGSGSEEKNQNQTSIRQTNNNNDNTNNSTTTKTTTATIRIVKLTRENVQMATREDILVVGLGGYCDGWGDLKLDASWMEEHFRGTAVLWFNDEFFGPYDQTNENNNQTTIVPSSTTLPPSAATSATALPLPLPPSRRHYHFGFEADGCQSIRIHGMALFFADHFEDSDCVDATTGRNRFADAILQADQKPVNTGERFLLYVARNCVSFREDAFDRLANLNILATTTASDGSLAMLDYGAKCRGRQNHTNAQKVGMPWKLSRNFKKMQEYRFCLVMENTKRSGYISEKILLAFVGGCVPIYYGTRDVFDVFNPKAFVYYDVENPDKALTEIVRLENDRKAYEQILREPILREGNRTIQQYFSLSESIYPNATLKQKVRNLLLHRGNKDPRLRCQNK